MSPCREQMVPGSGETVQGFPELHSANRAQMADGTAGGDGLGGADDGLGVDAVVAVEIGDGAGLAKVLDAKGADAMTVNGAQPGERRGMAVEHGDKSAVR